MHVCSESGMSSIQLRNNRCVVMFVLFSVLLGTVHDQRPARPFSVSDNDLYYTIIR